MRSAPRVAVVDYGSGNLRSVAKALERSGLVPEVTGDPAALARADAVVLPGVGAFADAARSLRAKGLDLAVQGAIEAGRPYLGLCLGLQLLFDESEEHGHHAGFGLLPGRVARFPTACGGERLRVPHIGWNQVRFAGEHPLLEALGEIEGARDGEPLCDYFYFVHAYRAVPEEETCVAGRAEYGEPFAAAVAAKGVFAVQFHPEKSQAAGRRLLDAFATWVARCA